MATYCSPTKRINPRLRKRPKRTARFSPCSLARTTTYRLPKRKLAPFARRFESTLPILEIVIAEESLPNPEDEPIPALMRVFDREGVNRPGAMPSALLPFARVRHRGASSMHSHYRQHSIRLEIRDEKLMVHSRNKLVYVADLGQIMLAKLTPGRDEAK